VQRDQFHLTVHLQLLENLTGLWRTVGGPLRFNNSASGGSLAPTKSYRSDSARQPVFSRSSLLERSYHCIGSDRAQTLKCMRVPQIWWIWIINTLLLLAAILIE